MSVQRATGEAKVRRVHLERSAVIYIRQSTLAQVRENACSTERQYALEERALGLSWPKEHIEVVDQDLGCSGAQAAGRMGFQRLVAKVSLGEVGAVFGLEVSRLARSSADWHRLLELCALFDTLIVDEDGIYDLAEFNDRLVLGLKGTMSEAELHYLRSRLIEGKKVKASKGELRQELPVGYLYDELGRVVVDPDEEVRSAVAAVFRAFRRAGSAYGALKALVDQPFPKRAYGASGAGRLCWGRLTHGRIRSILKNPTYAGAYVFGRYRTHKAVGEHGALIVRSVEVPLGEWAVLIHDHHEGYIDWAEYLENQKRLEKNRTNAPATLTLGPAREGRALLQGLAVCGGCGGRLTVRYAGNGGIYPQYECNRASREGLSRLPGCRSLGADLVDQEVVARVLGALTPAHLELASESLAELEARREQERLRWRQRRERLVFEAARAERQYQACEPENRLVARTLESRWNDSLLELARFDEEWAEKEQQWARQEAPSKEQVLAIARDLPRLWDAASTSSADRKRILRTLIEDVTISSDPEGPAVELGLRWRGGAAETLRLTRRARAWDQVRTPQQVVEAVRTLAAELTDKELAERLNREGWRSGKGRPFTKAAVQWIRCRHGIPGPAALSPGEYTVKAAAEHFNVSPNVIYYWIERGELKASKQAPGWPWRIRLEAETEARLRAWVQTSSRLNQPAQVPNPTPRSAI